MPMVDLVQVSIEFGVYELNRAVEDSATNQSDCCRHSYAEALRFLDHTLVIRNEIQLREHVRIGLDQRPSALCGGIELLLLRCLEAGDKTEQDRTLPRLIRLLE